MRFSSRLGRYLFCMSIVRPANVMYCIRILLSVSAGIYFVCLSLDLRTLCIALEFCCPLLIRDALHSDCIHPLLLHICLVAILRCPGASLILSELMSRVHGRQPFSGPGASLILSELMSQVHGWQPFSGPGASLILSELMSQVHGWQPFSGPGASLILSELMS